MTARIVFRIFVLALLLYSAVTNICPAGGKSEKSILGWMLRGHVYDTLLAERPFTCAFKCREDNRCQSINWVISLLMCEFNNRTKEARPEDFIPNQDRSYYRRDLQRGEPSLNAVDTLKLTGPGRLPPNGVPLSGFIYRKERRNLTAWSIWKGRKMSHLCRPIKWLKRGNRCILWMWNTRRKFFLFCAYSCLKDRAFTAFKRDAKLP